MNKRRSLDKDLCVTGSSALDEMREAKVTAECQVLSVSTLSVCLSVTGIKNFMVLDQCEI